MGPDVDFTGLASPIQAQPLSKDLEYLLFVERIKGSCSSFKSEPGAFLGAGLLPAGLRTHEACLFVCLFVFVDSGSAPLPGEMLAASLRTVTVTTIRLSPCARAWARARLPPVTTLTQSAGRKRFQLAKEQAQRSGGSLAESCKFSLALKSSQAQFSLYRESCGGGAVIVWQEGTFGDPQ